MMLNDCFTNIVEMISSSNFLITCTYFFENVFPPMFAIFFVHDSKLVFNKADRIIDLPVINCCILRHE